MFALASWRRARSACRARAARAYLLDRLAGDGWPLRGARVHRDDDAPLEDEAESGGAVRGLDVADNLSLEGVARAHVGERRLRKRRARRRRAAAHVHALGRRKRRVRRQQGALEQARVQPRQARHLSRAPLPCHGARARQQEWLVTWMGCWAAPALDSLMSSARALGEVVGQQLQTSC